MASIGEGGETGNIRNVIRIDEGEIRNHLDGLVKTSKVDPNHWTVFCRFLASEIPQGLSLVSVTQA